MKKLFLILGLITFAFLIANLPATTAAGGLNCTIETSSTCPSGFTKFMGLENDTGGTTNAHAQSHSLDTYANSLCCKSTLTNVNISNSCTNGTVFLRLSNDTNAHVQTPESHPVTYTVDACMNSTHRTPTFTYTESCTDECLVSMASSGSSNKTNAHVAVCPHYALQVCGRLNNSLPTFTQGPEISTNSGNNRTTDDLNLTFTPSDGDGDPLTANISWKNDSGVQYTDNGNPVTLDTENSFTLGSGNTTKGENWTADVTLSDGSNSTTESSNTLQILNTPPTAPTLLHPEDNDTTFTDRTPTFNWTASTDPDQQDTIDYRIELALDSSFTNIVTNTTTSNTFYPQSNDLDFTTYYWRVTARDGTDTATSETFNFTVTTLAQLNLTTDTVDFGTLDPGTMDNTTDDTPPPLVMENTGNIELNVSINATQLLEQASLDSNNYQYKADNVTGEEGAYNTATTTFTNMTGTATEFVTFFNYSDTHDELEIDLSIIVPDDEPAGTKKSNITVTGVQS